MREDSMGTWRKLELKPSILMNDPDERRKERNVIRWF